MKKRFLTIQAALVLILTAATFAQKIVPPKIKGANREADLLELVKLDPTIKLDIRYARSDNFVGRPVYSEARAFLQRPAAEAVVRVQKKLKKQGLGLVIFDGYRPWTITKLFWEVTPEEKRKFVANLATGSRHNRGCAVDLSIYDLKTGRLI
ncbi:MAG: M15 family metallopeptidase, partial [Pyrinomonadaceae bacterium]